MTRARKCPFHGCELMVPSTMFACRKHWYSLNVDQQAEIYAAYAAWKCGNITGDELRRRQQAVLDQTQVGGSA
jgi:hypothetical protein